MIIKVLFFISFDFAYFVSNGYQKQRTKETNSKDKFNWC